MRLKKFLKRTAIALCIVLLAGVFVVENVLPYSGIKPYRLNAENAQWRLPQGYLPENYGLRGSDFSFVTKDSILLKCDLLDSNLDTTKATVIILHGIGSCKETQFGRASMLADAGFASVVVDLRAHGKSGGEYCTFGYYEKNDIKEIVDRLKAQHPERPIGIWGASLGGAIALQAMGEDPRIQFGIIESTFDEFEKVAIEYGADMMLGIHSQWLTDHVIAKSGRIAHFDPFAVKPVVSAAKIKAPVLFIHGDQDDKIPIEFNQRNYEAVESAEKQWITVPGASHNNVWGVGGAALIEQIQIFLKRLVLRR